MFAGRAWWRRSGYERVSVKPLRTQLLLCWIPADGFPSVNAFARLCSSGWGVGVTLKAVFILVLRPSFPGGSQEAALTPAPCPGPGECCWKDVEVALADAGRTSAAATHGAPCWQQILGVWLQLLVPVALNNHPSPSLCSGYRGVTLSPAKCNGAAPRNIINLSVPCCDSCLCLLLRAGICSPASLSQSCFLKVIVDVSAALMFPAPSGYSWCCQPL